jgi:hypothetical protein
VPIRCRSRQRRQTEIILRVRFGVVPLHLSFLQRSGGSLSSIQLACHYRKIRCLNIVFNSVIFSSSIVCCTFPYFLASLILMSDILTSNIYCTIAPMKPFPSTQNVPATLANSTPLAKRKAITPTPNPSIRVNPKNAPIERNTTSTKFLKTTASLVSSDDDAFRWSQRSGLRQDGYTPAELRSEGWMGKDLWLHEGWIRQ